MTDNKRVGNIFLQGVTKFPWESQIWNWPITNRDFRLYHVFLKLNICHPNPSQILTSHIKQLAISLSLEVCHMEED